MTAHQGRQQLILLAVLPGVEPTRFACPEAFWRSPHPGELVFAVLHWFIEHFPHTLEKCGLTAAPHAAHTNRQRGAGIFICNQPGKGNSEVIKVKIRLVVIPHRLIVQDFWRFEAAVAGMIHGISPWRMSTNKRIITHHSFSAIRLEDSCGLGLLTTLISKCFHSY